MSHGVMIGKMTEKEPEGVWLCVSAGQIDLNKCDNESETVESEAVDVMVGAVLEELYGDISSLRWHDAIAILRKRGLRFKISA